MNSRPMPPECLVDPESEGFVADGFVPSDELALWARSTFIEEGAVLENPEHAHLRMAEIGFLWTNAANRRRGKMVLASAEQCPPQVAAGKWVRARMARQIEGWFGFMPDFLITVQSVGIADCDDAAFCALIEHELLHCGQAHDEWGAPRFNRQTGLPTWAIRGHDIEEFNSVVQRYGLTDQAQSAFVQSAFAEPKVGKADIAGACGTCLRRVA